MTKDHFAHAFGFQNYDKMLRHSMIVYEEDNVCWYVTKIPHGNFLTWNSAEIADDRVELFFTKEEAQDYVFKLKNALQPGL
ncbi:MAG: hypothetical protein GX248_09130 [Peptococcaceae bacterium]|jgi:hypothetical protein|nr:hypothetical protein [Peptococcaceae bacterium]